LCGYNGTTIAKDSSPVTLSLYYHELIEEIAIVATAVSWWTDDAHISWSVAEEDDDDDDVHTVHTVKFVHCPVTATRYKGWMYKVKGSQQQLEVQQLCVA
jgi:hypothetical protein